MSVFDIGQIAPQLLQQVNQLGSLLLRQQCHFKVQMSTLLGEARSAILLGQNNRSRQQCTQAEYSLQPEKRRWIELVQPQLVQHYIGEHPGCDEEQNKAEKKGLPGKQTDAFDNPLRAADLLIFARIELEDSLNVLTDLGAFGSR